MKGACNTWACACARTCSKSENGRHSWKVLSERNVSKNLGHDDEVKLLPRLVSNGLGRSDNDTVDDAVADDAVVEDAFLDDVDAVADVDTVDDSDSEADVRVDDTDADVDVDAVVNGSARLMRRIRG